MYTIEPVGVFFPLEIIREVLLAPSSIR